MHIEYLSEHTSLVPQLARLHFEQWGYLRPAVTLEQRIARLQAGCGRGGVPTVLVALEDAKLCGSAMLLANDMETRPELTPWLAGVYVVAACRERGYGTALVGRAESEARALGVRRLYLYTPDAAAFYVRLGWIVTQACEYLGQAVVVMSKQL